MKKNIRVFQTQSEYNTFISGDDVLRPNVSYVRGENEVHYNKIIDYSKEYLTFEALQSGTFTLTVPAAVDSTKMTSISYSTDNGTTWTDTTIDSTAQTITTPTINAGDKVLWKGSGNAMNGSSFSATGNFNISGNIMSLVYDDNFRNQTTFPSGSTYTFTLLFNNNTKLISAENLSLPATTLVQGCYNSMFYGCTSLTTTPVLPATNLENLCYQEMFNGCTSLTTAPVLPATTLKERCYSGMFYNCTSLTTAPVLPATNLMYGNYCYQYMFYGCTSLTTTPVLPATTLVLKCYLSMFQNCTNLNSITMLATNISASDCLKNWVQGVAATGTFTKAASMSTLPTGASGIPSGWTVVDA